MTGQGRVLRLVLNTDATALIHMIRKYRLAIDGAHAMSFANQCHALRGRSHAGKISPLIGNATELRV